ncbi:PD-(D/E)XK motif protein [Kineosporia sp. R_H_3]|uniref:PD-(D/E)XK motif protein n=1 Tax=Kineosporia sp. R_H_3 TaxID=1961848 RepID=UPI000B4BB7EE|nr:PD-(D/E)XK motif protein [Kineosporia sp. R_H_3]
MMSGPAEDRRRVHKVLDDLWQQIVLPGPSDALLTAEVHLRTSTGSLRVGRDRDGLPHLLVPVPAAVATEHLRGTDGVTIRDRVLLLDDGVPVRFIDLGCTREDLARVFAGLSVDICLRVAGAPEHPVAAVNGVIEEWRSLLDRSTSEWTRSRSAGLFAELVILRRILTIDESRLDLWTGPLGQAQDFRGVRAAVEVKATLGGEGRLVRIHGSDQLEVPVGGQLHLAWFRLDDRHAEGTTVRAVLGEVAALASDVKQWADCVARLGVPTEKHPELDERTFFVVEERCYVVDDAFPRIVPSSFVRGALPAGVGGVEYLVDLDVVPTSSLTEPVPVLRRLCGAM